MPATDRCEAKRCLPSDVVIAVPELTPTQQSRKPRRHGIAFRATIRHNTNLGGIVRTFNVQSLISLILVGTTTSMLCTAGSPSIGVAVAKGSFQLEDSVIWNNATIFDGSTVGSETAPLRLRLKNGTQMRMAAASKATVYGNHAVLTKGAAQFAGFANFPLEANNLRISALSPNSVVQLQRTGSNTLVVSADKGSVLVATAAGLPVANLPAGSSVSFDGQADANASSQMSGCLTKRDGAYVLTGGVSNLNIELRGEDLEKHVGQSVEVYGEILAGVSSPVKDVTQVLKVTNLKVLAPTCTGARSHHDKVSGFIVAAALATTGFVIIWLLDEDGKVSNSR